MAAACWLCGRCMLPANAAAAAGRPKDNLALAGHLMDIWRCAEDNVTGVWACGRAGQLEGALWWLWGLAMAGITTVLVRQECALRRLAALQKATAAAVELAGVGRAVGELSTPPPQNPSPLRRFREPCTWRVVFRSRGTTAAASSSGVRIRGAPCNLMSGAQLGVKRYGDAVRATHMQGDWIKLDGWDHPQAWMLTKNERCVGLSAAPTVVEAVLMRQCRHRGVQLLRAEDALEFVHGRDVSASDTTEPPTAAGAPSTATGAPQDAVTSRAGDAGDAAAAVAAPEANAAKTAAAGAEGTLSAGDFVLRVGGSSSREQAASAAGIVTGAPDGKGAMVTVAVSVQAASVAVHAARETGLTGVPPSRLLHLCLLGSRRSHI
jgi:hypothetical protein